MAQKTEELTVDKLLSFDKAAIFVTGLTVAHALKQSKTNIVALTVDCLGKVVLLPEDAVSVSKIPVVSDQDLDGFPEDEAINIMVLENRSDEEMVRYLKTRKKEVDNG